MEFGTLIWSKKKSFSIDQKRVGEHYLSVLTVRPAMYCMTRPDTGNIIMELNGMMCQEKQENVRLFLQEKESCLDYIQSIFAEKERKYQNAIQVLEEQDLPSVTQKLESLQKQYEQTKQKNETECTETRMKSIKELEKSIRKYRRKMEAMQNTIVMHQDTIKDFIMAKEYSLEQAKEVFAKYGA